MEEDLCDLDLEMPWFKWCRKENAAAGVNYKSKVEQKLLLARQDPEPVFDLTECNLLDVPSGVYSWCKVCLKQRLLLQNNRLKSISGGGNISDLFNIRMMDVSNNNLSKLPEEFGLMTNLQALYICFNQLKTLPSTFSQLKNLQILNLKGNCFATFPTTLCLLPKLKKLDISSNSIRQLPNSLTQLTTLNALVIDADTYDHPNSGVCRQGLAKIMEFLCKEGGAEYQESGASEVDCSYSLDSALNTAPQDAANGADQRQVQHLQALMETEKNLMDLYTRLSQSQANKQIFLKGLIQDQDRLDEELSFAQNRKDESRQKLLQELLEVEQESNFAIEELLELSRLSRTNDALLETLENDRREFEKVFINSQNDSLALSRKEVLAAMESTLENQYRQARSHLAAYSWTHKEMLAQTQLNELMQALKLEEIMTKCGEDQANLIAQLLQDEEYQKRAFAELMLRKDEEYIRLSDQISLIENELANLTLLEIRRQDLKVKTEKNILEDQRAILTSLLVQLITQQENRSREFENRVREMEAMRSQEQVDFWLRQYQRLLESKPHVLAQQEKLLEEDVKSVLERAGATHLLPLLANRNLNLSQMDEQQLLKLGVDDSAVRRAILNEVNNAGGSSGGRTAAMRQASIRARFEVECVICMERACTALYLHCGHVCCCAHCAPSVTSCPLCRTPIERIFLLNHVPSAPLFDL